MSRVTVKWTGRYPTLCYGKWVINVDGIPLTGIGNGNFKTYGNYHRWYFVDWSDEWDRYEDGEEFEVWDWSRNGLKDSLERHGIEVTKELMLELYKAIQMEDWRSNSCGGCI